MPETDWIDDQIEALKEQNLYNNIPVIESPIGPEIIINGKKVLNFCSNNYLGLANHPNLREGAIEAIKKFGGWACRSSINCRHYNPS